MASILLGFNLSNRITEIITFSLEGQFYYPLIFQYQSLIQNVKAYLSPPNNSPMVRAKALQQHVMLTAENFEAE